MGDFVQGSTRIPIGGDMVIDDSLRLVRLPGARGGMIGIAGPGTGDPGTGVSLHAESHQAGGPDALDLDASQIVAGVLAVARGGTGLSTVGAANTVLQSNGSTLTYSKVVDAVVDAAAAIAWSKISKSGAVPGDVGAAAASHTHSAADIVSGVLADARLSSNVGLLNGSQIWTGTHNYEGGATNIFTRSRVATDTIYRYQRRISGAQEWGPGGAGAFDTFFSRAAAGNLQITGLTAAEAALRIVASNTVGGAGNNAAIYLYDAGTFAGSFGGSFSPAAGSREIQFVARTDRDGNRMPLALYSLDAGGTARMGFQLGAGANAFNAALFGTGSWGGGSKVLFIANRTTSPITDPVGGGVLMAINGGLYWHGSSGTVTHLAAA